MHDITINILLDYAYRYALTLIICTLGSFVRDGYDTLKYNNKINIIRIIISSLFSAIVLCAIDDYLQMSFGIYIFISFLGGVWGFNLLGIIFNTKFMVTFIKNIFKEISTPITKGISSSIEEIQEENKEKDKKENDSNSTPP